MKSTHYDNLPCVRLNRNLPRYSAAFGLAALAYLAFVIASMLH